jgi:hypothetical protein
MAKCINCKSCLDIVYIDNKRYLFCALCRKIYVSDLDGNIKEIKDKIILDRIVKLRGRII